MVAPGGALNLQTACNALPDSDERRIVNAYMDPLTPATPSYIGLTLARSVPPPMQLLELADTQYNYETVPGK